MKKGFLLAIVLLFLLAAGITAFKINDKIVSGENLQKATALAEKSGVSPVESKNTEPSQTRSHETKPSFSENTASTNSATNNNRMAAEEKRNMEILTKAMLESGFKPIETEWWHYDDADTYKYNVIDTDLGQFSVGKQLDRGESVQNSKMDKSGSEQTFDIEHLKCLGNSEQAVIVTINSYESSTATIYTFEKINGKWKMLLSVPAIIAKRGFTYDKVEGDNKSPIGCFNLERCFSRVENPGTKLKFTRFGEDSYWVDDVKSIFYNTFQTGPANGRWTSAEDLFKIGEPYKYFLVVEYNTSDRIPDKGSAIFLHTWIGENVPTTGCTAMSQENLKSIIKWLDPAKKPKLVQGPLSDVMKM